MLLFHFLLLRYRLCTFGFSVLQHISGHSDAVGGSRTTLLLLYSLLATRERVYDCFPEVFVTFLSRSSLDISSLSFPSESTFINNLFSCNEYSIRVCYESSLEKFLPDVNLIRTVHTAVHQVFQIFLSRFICRLFSLTENSSHLIATITQTITIQGTENKI